MPSYRFRPPATAQCNDQQRALGAVPAGDPPKIQVPVGCRAREDIEESLEGLVLGLCSGGGYYTGSLLEGLAQPFYDHQSIP